MFEMWNKNKEDIMIPYDKLEINEWYWVADKGDTEYAKLFRNGKVYIQCVRVDEIGADGYCWAIQTEEEQDLTDFEFIKHISKPKAEEVSKFMITKIPVKPVTAQAEKEK